MARPPASVKVARPFDHCTTNEEVNEHFKAEFARLGYGHGTPLEDNQRLGELARLAHERIKNEPAVKAAAKAERDSWTEEPASEADSPAPARQNGKTMVTAKTGSRFTLGHLIEAGKLAEGERLTWTYHGTTYEIHVREGQLDLGEGRLTESPSAACKTMNNGGSFNGWKFWVSESGKTLLELRAEVTG